MISSNTRSRGVRSAELGRLHAEHGLVEPAAEARAARACRGPAARHRPRASGTPARRASSATAENRASPAPRPAAKAVLQEVGLGSPCSSDATRPSGGSGQLARPRRCRPPPPGQQRHDPVLAPSARASAAAVVPPGLVTFVRSCAGGSVACARQLARARDRRARQLAWPDPPAGPPARRPRPAPRSEEDIGRPAARNRGDRVHQLLVLDPVHRRRPPPSAARPARAAPASGRWRWRTGR